MTTLVYAAELVAQQPNNFGDTRSGGLAGPFGLFLIVMLALATAFLIRNMNSRLKRLPERFPSPREGDTDHAAQRSRTDSTVTGVDISTHRDAGSGGSANTPKGP